MEYIHTIDKIAAYAQDGKILAEVDFPPRGGNIVEVTHTFVDDSLRGQGVAAELMRELAQDLRSSGRKAILTCSYAVKWFAKNTEYSDVLEQN
ncbi:MAG: GNAT family N-acetyltransferase [Oscillospiraceae bacterium]